MSFVDLAPDWYSSRVPAIIYTISYSNGPRYNGTPLYCDKLNGAITALDCITPLPYSEKTKKKLEKIRKEIARYGKYCIQCHTVFLCILSNLCYKLHQIPKHKYFSFRLAFVFAQSIEARCSVENEDEVRAAPTGDAPTTSEWSAILLPTKVWLILQFWQYFYAVGISPWWVW